jgi:hypothetical protein
MRFALAISLFAVSALASEQLLDRNLVYRSPFTEYPEVSVNHVNITESD